LSMSIFDKRNNLNNMTMALAEKSFYQNV
jgi:hypothetical protein